MTTLLIDGDICAYQYSSASEHEVDWGEDIWTLWSDRKEASNLITQYVDHLLEATEADKVIFAFTDKENFRKKINPNYKVNRKKIRKPVCYKALVKWITDNYETYVRPELEADDVLGILSTHPTLIKGRKIVVSEDKDLMTIPGLLWKSGELHEIGEEVADYNFLKQTLTGDATDGYSGVPGIGAVTADKILTKECSWQVILDCFAKANLDENEALLQARMARILRASDYDFKNKQIKLWSPNVL